MYVVFGSIAIALILFIWGRVRHDLVALLILVFLTLTGYVPASEAFSGFSNPAVISVAAILIVSQGLRSSGFVELVSARLQNLKGGTGLQVALLSLLVCSVSAFMNNIGALAVFLPVAVQLSRQRDRPASLILMPLAFASLLGGMITLIGTPPNMIISSFRMQAGGAGYRMFDFAPVGLSLAVLGLSFISVLGWRVLPHRKGANQQGGFKAERYLTELRIPESSPLVGRTLSELGDLAEQKLQVFSLLSALDRSARPEGGSGISAALSRLRGFIFRAAGAAPPRGEDRLKAGDILVVHADPESLKSLAARKIVVLSGEGTAGEPGQTPNRSLETIEAVVLSDSPLVKRTASSLALRDRYGLSLLALSRQGAPLVKRIDKIAFQPGDLLLLKRPSGNEAEQLLSTLGCLPLGVHTLGPRRLSTAILAIGLVIAAAVLVISGAVPVQISFLMAAGAMVLVGILPLEDIYNSVDWPIIVLLGAMLPVGAALESSGGAQAASRLILGLGAHSRPWTLLAILTGSTMLLSAVINNAATVVLMAPIGLRIAQGLGASADPFLMAIAIGASCSFLTPIAHQSNVLVMGPGGYRFADYLRLGLPLSILMAGAAVPLILAFWPL